MADETKVPQGEEKEIPQGEEKETPKGEEKETPKGEEKETPKGKGKGKDKPAKDKSTEAEAKSKEDEPAELLKTHRVRRDTLKAAVLKGVKVVEFDLNAKKAIYTNASVNEERAFDSSLQAQQTALSEQYKKDTLVVINGRLAALCEKRLKDFGFVLEYLAKDKESKLDNAFIIDWA